MKDHHLKHMDQESKDHSPESEDINYQNNPVKKFLNKQSKQTRLIILISVIGLLAFTLAAATVPFKDQLFQALYPKPQSLAADPIDDLTNQLLQVSREYNMALTESGIEVTATPSATPSATDTPSSTPVSSPAALSSPTPAPIPTTEPSPTSTTLQPTVSGNTDTNSSVKGEKVSQKALQKQDKMVTIAKKRKELLLEKMRTNPQEFLNKATLADKIQQFPDEVRPYIEERFEAEGKLRVIHIDDFDNKKSRLEYFLERGSNKKDQNRYKLSFVKDPPKVISGSEVQVKGVELEQQVALSTGNAQASQEGLQIIAAATLLPATGEQKTAVLLVNFADNPNEKPYTVEQIKDLIFNAPKSVNNYYKENSFNRAFFTGDVFGWYTISPPDCDPLKYPDLAEKAAEASGIYLKNEDQNYYYSKILLVLAKSNICTSPFGGMADIGGNPGRAWIFRHDAFSVYSHELGHNLGVDHANKTHCNIGNYTACNEVEYGDYSDVMGIFRDSINDSFHFNAPHKSSLGWFSNTNQQTVTNDGIFILSSLEDNNTPIKVLKIPKNDTNEYYYLSYRQKTGFDSTLPSGITDGLSIHLWNSSPNVRGEPYKTKLIDASDRGLYLESLKDGMIFYDNINRFSVKQLSHTNSDLVRAGSVTVEIKFNVLNPINYLINSWQTLSSMFQIILPFGIRTERPIRDHSLISYNGFLFNEKKLSAVSAAELPPVC